MKITKSGLLQLLIAITLILTISITTPAAGYNDYAPHASVNDTNVYSKQLILNIIQRFIYPAMCDWQKSSVLTGWTIL